MRPLGVGIIGVGPASQPHFKALADLADIAEIRGVWSRSGAQRESFGITNGFATFDTAEALLATPDIDVVALLTPPNARLPYIELATRAKKHVLMEKPIERTSAAAEEIVAAMERAQLKLGIVFQHRYRESAIKAAELIKSGLLGATGMIYVSVPWWRPQSYYDEPGRGTFARDGGGVLISQAIHSLDLMLSLAAPVAEVQAVIGTTRMHDMETEDFAAAGLRFADGALGSIMATTASFPGEAEVIVFDCENANLRLAGGLLTVKWRDARTDKFGAEVSTGGGASIMDFPHDWHRSLWRDFLEAVRNDREPAVNGRSALRVHYLIDALLGSSRERRAIAVRSN